MKNFIFLLPWATTLLLIHSCSKESIQPGNYTDTANCTDTAPTYDASVKSILDNSCAYSGCHSANSRKAGVQLNDYAHAKREFLNGRALCTIYYDCTPMPRNAAKLNNNTIQLLTCWVKDGCP